MHVLGLRKTLSILNDLSPEQSLREWFAQHETRASTTTHAQTESPHSHAHEHESRGALHASPPEGLRELISKALASCESFLSRHKQSPIEFQADLR